MGISNQDLGSGLCTILHIFLQLYSEEVSRLLISKNRYVNAVSDSVSSLRILGLELILHIDSEQDLSVTSDHRDFKRGSEWLGEVIGDVEFLCQIIEETEFLSEQFFNITDQSLLKDAIFVSEVLFPGSMLSLLINGLHQLVHIK